MAPTLLNADHVIKDLESFFGFVVYMTTMLLGCGSKSATVLGCCCRWIYGYFDNKDAIKACYAKSLSPFPSEKLIFWQSRCRAIARRIGMSRKRVAELIDGGFLDTYFLLFF
ncbi:hypothetical protein RND81_07G126400 [Saponaria officinalis]|uniref:Uncharacterized protein n=1 Tax=Saponaria officinalis TaxID=3572 RepID=A0AAW1JRX4_SAPOF